MAASRNESAGVGVRAPMSAAVGGDPRRRLYGVLSAALIAWTILAGAGFAWVIKASDDGIIELARMQAVSEWRKDILYRRWNATRSPVYVAVTEATPPNPYLAGVPERDIRTPSGRELTLVNPAYMTRQVHELGVSDGVHGHITSLKPIRPENAPDEWERMALERLAAGDAEVTQIASFRDGDHLRFMRPLQVEKSCLRCHASQGYKEGDLRGGISIAIGLDPLRLATSSQKRAHVLVTALLWFCGVLAIAGGGYWLKSGIDSRLFVEEALRASQEKEAATARLAALGTLSGGIAHHFNNILAALSGYSSFVKDDLEEAGMDTSNIEEVINAGNRAARLVAKMGAFVDAHDPNLSGSDLREAANRALDAMREFSGRALEVTIPPGAVVSADPDALSGTFQALFSNAFLAGAGDASGGGPVSVTAEKNHAGPDSTNPDKIGTDYWEVTVRDYGCGMSTETLKRVFEPFFTTRDVGAGDGLGLTLVKAQVESSGGSVRIESSPGSGTTVVFRLPAA